MSAALIQVRQLRVKPTAVAAAAHERARSRFSDFRHFCSTDTTFNDHRLSKADIAFESKTVGWEVKSPSPGSYLVEPLSIARIPLREIPRVEQSEYVGHFFSLISPPLVVL